MACKMHRRITLGRKLQILRTLTKSKSVKKSAVIMDSSLYIYKLKLQLEAIQKDIQEVKVEKLGEGSLVVKVSCKKGEELLVSILEAFEEMKLNVVRANITCRNLFAMEAIVEADVDATILNEAILKVVQMQNQRCTT